MKRRFLNYFILGCTAAAVLLIASCPLPITEELVAALEDSYDPVIYFDSHTDGDIFYSSVIIQGHITDDAISSGDGRGRLSRLSMEVDKEGIDYTGGLVIDSSGSISPDPDLGPIVISYPGDGTFSFEIDSSAFDEDIRIVVTAQDLNGNVEDEILELDSSGGPRVSITAPIDGDYYSTTSEITLTGTFYDSIELTTTIDEIASVRFRIPPEVDEEILLDGSSTTYVMEIANLPPYPAQFQIDNTSFSCTFSPKDSMKSNRTLEVTVTDRNGQSRSDSVTLYYTEGGPIVDVVTPTTTGNYHSSVKSDASFYLDFFANGTSSSIKTVSYQINSGAPVILYDYYSADPNLTFYPAGGRFRFGSIPYWPLLTITPDSYSGNITISFIATDLLDRESDPVTRVIYDDTQGPDYLGFRWENASGDPVAYAKDGDQVYMRFSLNDLLSGEDHSSLVISGTYDNAGFNSTLSSQAATEGPYELLFDFSTASPSDGVVPFTLYSEDMLDNDSVHDEGDDPLIYYHEAPSSSPTVSLTKNSNGMTPVHSNYLRGGETVIAQFNPGRDMDTAATEFYFVFDGGSETADRGITETSPGSGIYEAEYDIQNSDPDGVVGWRMVYVDMAGNSTGFSGSPTTFDIDNTDPDIAGGSTIESASSSYPAVVHNSHSGVVEFTPTDGGSGPSTSVDPEVHFYGNGSSSPDVTVTASDIGGGDWRGVSGSLGSSFPQGNMTAQVTIYDRAGNSATRSISGTVLVDTVAPTVLGTSSISSDSGIGGKAGIGDKVTVELDLNEDQDTGTSPTASLTASGTRNMGNISVINSDRTLQADYTVQEEGGSVPELSGSVTVDAVLTDQYGNSATRSYSFSLTLDNVKPSISITSPTGDPDYTQNTSFDVTATVSADTETATFDMDEDSTDIDEQTDNPSGTTATVSFTIPPPDGSASYTITATAVDEHGNASDTDTCTVNKVPE